MTSTLGWLASLSLALVWLPIAGVAAQSPEYLALSTLPALVRPFIEAGAKPLALDSADLNADRRRDYVLVFERPPRTPDDPASEKRQRPQLVLIGQPDGSLREAARNERVVYCRACGGVMGDPFQGITLGRSRFTVSLYGGSGWRWSVDYTFAWSRRDMTWQLVRVEESRFHAGDPTRETRTVSAPPRQFGKINFADFDPDFWRGRGAR